MIRFRKNGAVTRRRKGGALLTTGMPIKRTSGFARRWGGLAGLIVCLLVLAGCETASHDAGTGETSVSTPDIGAPTPLTGTVGGPEPPPDTFKGSPLPGAEIYLGRGTPSQLQSTQPPVAIGEGGDVVLNFVNADVREFLDTVLGKLLGVGYVVDPRVQGTVTLQTARAVPRNTVIGVIEDVLAMNGAALVQSGGVYKVVPLESAVSVPAILNSGTAPVRLDRGFALHIIPLRYASAAALREVVEPFVPPGRALRVDAERNLLIFSGTGPEAADFTELVGIFDLDWMAGKSFGLFPLKYADPKNVATELAHVFGQGAPGLPAGAVDVVPIDRLSAVLVITPQEAFLNEARTWIERLDRGIETDRRQLYVYYVQNGRATELADALGQAFAITAVGTAGIESDARLAPGLTPFELSQPQGMSDTSSNETGEPSPADSALPQTRSSTERGAGGLPVLGIGSPGPLEAGAEDTLRIVADARNNALLVYATGEEYRMIEAALRKLDIVPLQVLIEATIAEVTLNDSLKYGLEWFFDVGNSTVTFNTGANPPVATPTPTANLILSQFPGFSYVFASDDVKLVLNALSQITDVKVISSPQLMVLDNEPARLQVGDQVPVSVRSSVSTNDPDSPIVSEIEYRDTGVILDIIPRVNASGLVVLDIIQEVSDVVATVVTANTTTAVQSATPTIAQRRIASTVAINSGETVALGGLIRDSATNAVTGVPLLSEIPLLGNLFKTTTDVTRRTELLVLLTPRVVRDRHDARAITDELRQRLRGLEPLTEKIQ